jgi:polysaccharide pyruvyl transferase WcaK-like protein
VGAWDIFPLLNIPLYYLPQAWGPFNTPEGRRLGDRVVGGAKMVFARDSHSYQCLRELPSFSENKVYLASDIAFTFRGAPPAVGLDLLEELGCVPDGGPLIGIVPNMRVYERTPRQGQDNIYLQCLCAVVDYFIQQHSARIVLMPHEIRPSHSPVRDDRYLCQVLAQAVAQPQHVFPLLGEYSAEQLKSLIGHLDLIVSSRFHSIIAALSLRRPVVAVSWSHKYPELLQSVGLGEFTSSHQELNPSALVSLCTRVWAERQHLTALLKQHVPEHERSAESVLHTVAERIRHAGS